MRPQQNRVYFRITKIVEWTPPIFWLYCIGKGFQYNFAFGAILADELFKTELGRAILNLFF